MADCFLGKANAPVAPSVTFFVLQAEMVMCYLVKDRYILNLVKDRYILNLVKDWYILNLVKDWYILNNSATHSDSVILVEKP